MPYMLPGLPSLRVYSLQAGETSCSYGARGMFPPHVGVGALRPPATTCCRSMILACSSAGEDDANAFFRWTSYSLKNAIPLAYSALLDLHLLLSAKALYPYLVPHRAAGLTAEAGFAKAKTVAGLQLQHAIDQLSKLGA